MSRLRVRPAISEDQRNFVVAHMTLCRLKREELRTKQSKTLRSRAERLLEDAQRRMESRAAERRRKRRARAAEHAAERERPLTPREKIAAEVGKMTKRQKVDYRTFRAKKYGAFEAIHMVTGVKVRP